MTEKAFIILFQDASSVLVQTLIRSVKKQISWKQ